MKRFWLSASRSLEANSARVPGSPQRLEAHNLTVRALHGYAALPKLIPSDHPDAIALLTQLDSALALDPNLPTAFWLKASIESELGRSEQAIADFRRALALPYHPLDTALSLAMSLSDRGERQEALYIFEDLIAEIRERFDVPDLSQVTITQDLALAFKPGDAFPTLAAAHLGRGDIHQSYGRCDLARPDFETACKLGLPAGCERVCKE